MRFSMPVRCEQCDGNGTVESTVYAQDIMLIVLHNVVNGEIQKIPAIIQVRNDYGMGLKQAKELVEGAMDFFYTIEKHSSNIPNDGLSLHDMKEEYERTETNA